MKIFIIRLIDVRMEKKDDRIGLEEKSGRSAVAPHKIMMLMREA